MIRYFDKQKDKMMVNIKPEEMYVTTENECIFTVLGSCISVCLFDKIASIGGMNHFMLAKKNAKFSTDTIESGRYGETAIALLIEKMVKKDAQKGNLDAWIIGGSSAVSQCCMQHNIAKENALFAKQYLEQQRIPIIGVDTGGSSARKVYFDAHSGKVNVELVKRTGFDSCVALPKSEEDQLANTSF